MPETIQRRRLEGDTVQLGQQFREATFDRSKIDIKARTAEMSFSSETPYDRYWGTEILDHSPSAMNLARLNNGGALLVNHDWNDQVGVIEKAWNDGKNGRASVRFSRSVRGQEMLQDVQDGIRTLVSVGYQIDEMRLESTKDGAETYRVEKWTPLEVSLVAVPADPSVGIGREQEKGPTYAVRVHRPGSAINPPQGTPPERRSTMDITVQENAAAGAVAGMSNDVSNNLERARASNLQRLATQYKVDADTAQRWIEQGVSLDEAGNEVVKILAARSKEDASKSKLDMSKKDLKSYSILRAINAVLNKNWNGAGLELEASQEVQRRIGRTVNEHTFFVPLDVQQRDLIVGTSTMGGYLVSTGNVGFIELLRNRSVLFNMGATRLWGLQGSVAVPRQTAPGTGFWLATEATAATESQLVIGQMTLTPKNVGAYTEISRQLLLQGSPDAEGLVMSDLAAVIALAVDSAGLTGTGAPQPQGIVGTAGLGGVTITTGTVTYANVLEFQTDAAGANALTPASGYVTTPAIAAILKQKARFSNTDTPIWQGNVLDGNIEGIRAMTSNQVTAGQLLMGDFSKVVIAEWGTLEVEANPYANFAAGIVGVRAFYTCDVGVRYPGAFSLGTGITA